MLAMQARSYNTYIYLQTGNVNHPARYVQNKVCGILFENKVDHASTYARHSTMCICCKPLLLVDTAYLPTYVPRASREKARDGIFCSMSTFVC